MKNLVLYTVSALFFMGINASAATVQVDWTGSAPSSTQTNVWNYSQNGFDVTALTLLGSGIPVDLGDLTAGGGLPVNPATQYNYTRSNGGSFDLNSIDIGAAYSGYATIVTRVVGNDSIQRVVPYFWNAVKLVAVHTDGSVLTNTFSPWNNFDTGSTATFWYPATSKSGNNLFNQMDFGSHFTDLVSLTVSLIDPVISTSYFNNASGAFGNDFQNSYYCEQQQLSLYDPLLDVGSLCAGGTPEGIFSFDLQRYGSRNDSAALSINSVAFNTIPIASVPVPAGLPLLAGALGLVGFLRSQRNQA